MQRRLEAQRVVVGDHPGAAVLEHPASGGAAGEGPHELLGVEAGLDAQHDALRYAEVGAREDHLVHGLGRLAGPDGAHAGDRLAHRAEDGPGAVEVGLVAAHEDREGRLLGALRAARNRGIDEAHALGLQAIRKATGRRRGDGRAIDDERSGAGTGRNAVRAEQRGLHVRRVRDADHDHVRAGRELARRPGLGRAELQRGARPTRRPVPDRQREARPRDVGRHGHAHGSHSDEPDSFHGAPSCEGGDQSTLYCPSASQ